MELTKCQPSHSQMSCRPSLFVVLFQSLKLRQTLTDATDAADTTDTAHAKANAVFANQFLTDRWMYTRVLPYLCVY